LSPAAAPIKFLTGTPAMRHSLGKLNFDRHDRLANSMTVYALLFAACGRIGCIVELLTQFPV
jgi:hypothetical protein